VAEIRQISGDTKLPLNVLSWEGLPAPDQLQDADVRRLSAGSGISARVWAQAQAFAREFLEEGSLTSKSMPFADLQKLFT
jgi:2-methylisocitrate lyase-like PEP mutase family enzyme